MSDSQNNENDARYQNIEDFKDNVKAASGKIERDLANQKKIINEGVTSRQGMAIAEITERAEGFFSRTATTLDKIDGVRDGELRIPGIEKSTPIDHILGGFTGPEAREEIAAALSKSDIDKNGRISRSEIEAVVAPQSASQLPAQSSPNVNSMASGINSMSGMLTGVNLSLGVRHDAGAPAHDAATSAPPAAIQYANANKQEQVQQTGGGR